MNVDLLIKLILKIMNERMSEHDAIKRGLADHEQELNEQKKVNEDIENINAEKSLEQKNLSLENIESGPKKLKFTVKRPYFSTQHNLNGYYDHVFIKKNKGYQSEKIEEIELENKDGGNQVVDLDLGENEELIITHWHGSNEIGNVYFNNGMFPYIKLANVESCYAEDDENKDEHEPSFFRTTEEFFTKKESLGFFKIEIVE
jgi:hypothetical protein